MPIELLHTNIQLVFHVLSVLTLLLIYIFYLCLFLEIIYDPPRKDTRERMKILEKRGSQKMKKIRVSVCKKVGNVKGLGIPCSPVTDLQITISAFASNVHHKES